MSVPKILVIDDEPMICNMLYEALHKRHFHVDMSESGAEGITRIGKTRYDLVITDVYLPDMNGIEILKTAKEMEPDIGVIVITAHSSVESAVQAIKMGAYDYLTKGFSLEEIELTVEKYFKYQKLVQENERLRNQLGTYYGMENIIGNSDKIKEVFEIIEMVAPTNSTVLIQGESGTGKELVAKAIHQNSRRRDKPFIKTNCAAIPEGLVESELFGHEKGAFTGALKSTKGRFELADGGTILLDEISEIKPTLQAKLLRVLQEREFEKIGNPDTVHVDVRVIATTNKDLCEEIRKGNFREDLYYRLNVVPIQLPTLKERKEDIPLLVDHFIRKYAKENDRKVIGIDDKAMAYLLDYSWPGNVRELENMIERALVICRDDKIYRKHIHLGQSHKTNGMVKADCLSDLAPATSLKEMEKRLILSTLERENNNRTRAAEKLGITVRTLRNKLKEYAAETAADSHSR